MHGSAFHARAEERIAKVAEAQGIDAEGFVKNAGIRLLEDAEFRAAVREGIAQADRGEFVPDEEIEAFFEKVLHP